MSEVIDIKDIVWDKRYHVLVIGQGIAGASAALEAHAAGSDVLIVEQASGGGGASATSAGVFYLGGGTPVQQACDYDDSPLEMARFLLASTQNKSEAMIELFCNQSVEHFGWLEAQGVTFDRSQCKEKVFFPAGIECLFTTGNEKAWPFCEITPPIPRGHKVAAIGEGGGAAAMNALIATCQNAGINTLYDCRATALIRNGNRIVGATVRQNGETLNIAASGGIILATGSFNMNAQMVKENIPLLSETSIPIGIPNNDGFGLTLGRAAGGATEAMGGVMPTAPFYPPEQLIKGILINKNGLRFVAEDAYHGRSATFIMEQPDQTAYLIVDEEIFAYPEMELAGHTLVDGWETIAEMEGALEIPEGALQQTMARYNEDAANGVDTVLHKQPPWLKPLDKGPYAAFDVSFNKSAYVFMTLGGLKTGLDGEVLGESGAGIPGLYAAGAVSAHIPSDGKSYASGLSLAPGSFFGRRAGRHAAKNCLREPA